MVKGKIKFVNHDVVNVFVTKVSKYTMDIDIKYGTAVLDGKSLIGLIAIQPNVELSCTIHDSLENCKELIEDIKEFIVEDFK